METADRPRIDDLVKEGQEIVVQVTKDPLAGKGPRVTTGISLAGRTLVYLPGAREVGVSRRVSDEAERERLRLILEGFGGEGGFIARTAALGKSPEDLAADRRYLSDLAARIVRRRESSSPPALLHREAGPRVCGRCGTSPATTAPRSAWTTRPPTNASGSSSRPSRPPLGAAPRAASPVRSRSSRPSASRRKSRTRLKSRVSLASGGYLVIHQTEALVAIDVNTGRFVGKEGLEDTVFATNLEAVPEVARQIRLRDLGGLLVVDFIDMEDPEHRAKLFERFEAELAQATAPARAMLQISEFGLIEITRQRSRGNLERVLTRACPCCSGSGRIKTDVTVALDLRRALLTPPNLYSAGETVRVRVRPGVAQLVAEDDPALLADAETALGVRLELVPDEAVGASGFEILNG